MKRFCIDNNGSFREQYPVATSNETIALKHSNVN